MEHPLRGILSKLCVFWVCFWMSSLPASSIHIPLLASQIALFSCTPETYQSPAIYESYLATVSSCISCFVYHVVPVPLLNPACVQFDRSWSVCRPATVPAYTVLYLHILYHTSMYLVVIDPATSDLVQPVLGILHCWHSDTMLCAKYWKLSHPLHTWHCAAYQAVHSKVCSVLPRYLFDGSWAIWMFISDSCGSQGIEHVYNMGCYWYNSEYMHPMADCKPWVRALGKEPEGQPRKTAAL